MLQASVATNSISTNRVSPHSCVLRCELVHTMPSARHASEATAPPSVAINCCSCLVLFTGSHSNDALLAGVTMVGGVVSTMVMWLAE